MTINILSDKIDSASKLAHKLEVETKTSVSVLFCDTYWRLEVLDCANIENIIFCKEFDTLDELNQYIVILWTGAMIANRKDI